MIIVQPGYTPSRDSHHGQMLSCRWYHLQAVIQDMDVYSRILGLVLQLVDRWGDASTYEESGMVGY